MARPNRPDIHPDVRQGIGYLRRQSPFQGGVSMIEVLVSILIVSLGILALAGLLGVSTRLGKTSEFRATAALLTAELADRMRANRPGADAGNYNLPNTALKTTATSASPCAVTACSAAEMAAADLAEWQARLYNALPSGTGYISYSAGVADVWVAWRDPDALSLSDTSDNALITANITNRCPPNFSTTSKPTCVFFRVGL